MNRLVRSACITRRLSCGCRRVTLSRRLDVSCSSSMTVCAACFTLLLRSPAVASVAAKEVALTAILRCLTLTRLLMMPSTSLTAPRTAALTPLRVIAASVASPEVKR